MIKKKCIDCGDIKPLDDFYHHKDMVDKHLNKCKTCCKNYQKLERLKNPEKMRLYEAKRNKNKKRIMKSALRTKEWRKMNPEKYKAQNKLNNALRDKKIVKPEKCEICDSNYHIHAHHEDYTKPLEVVWICAKCHGQIQ